MKDDEKKIIKDSIEHAIDNKLSAYDKKLQADRKSDAQNYLKQQEQNKQELLKELRALDDKGQATMAQKFELFKLSLQEHKQKPTVTGKKQAPQKVIKTNPLFVMLHENKELFSDLWEIANKTARKGADFTKSATSLLKAAIKKPQQEEEIEEQLNLPKPKFDTNIETQTETILQEKEDWKRKIDEIHHLIVDTKKDGDRSTTVLAKGLKGLNNTMNVISDGIKFIHGKEKLILSGIMLGAVGILSLVGWFKSGGFNKTIDKMQNELLTKLGSKQGQEKRQQADQYVQGQLQDIKTDATNTQNMLNDMDLSQEADFSKTTYMLDANNKKNIHQIRSESLSHAVKQQGATDQEAQRIQRATQFGTIAPKAIKSSINKTISFKLPFDVTITNTYNTEDNIHVDFTIVRQIAKSYKTVYITNAIKQSIKKGKVAKGQQIASLDIGFRIIGDWEDFLGVNEQTTLEDAIYTDRAQDISKQANKIMDEAYHNPGIGNDVVSREADKRVNVFKEYNVDNLKSEQEITDEAPANLQDNVDTRQISSTSVNPEKVIQQQEQLYKKEETVAKKEVQDNKPQTQTTPLLISQAPVTPVRWADRALSPNEYLNMSDYYIDTNGVC